MLRDALSLLVPPRCPLCAAPVGAHERVCERCARAIRGRVRSRVAGLALVSAAPYEREARRLVARLKFTGHLGLAAEAAEAMLAACGEELPRVVVPVPAAPARLRRRGFDVGALLARRFAGAAGIRAASCLRRGDGPRQVGRSRADRLRDAPRISATSEAADLVDVGGVWLVDDVVTTGATLLASAAALRSRGVEPAGALTFARSQGLGESGPGA